MFSFLVYDKYKLKNSPNYCSFECSTSMAASEELDLLSERELKSSQFNGLRVGDRVIIEENKRLGHHDITSRKPFLLKKVEFLSC